MVANAVLKPIYYLTGTIKWLYGNYDNIKKQRNNINS